MDNLIAGLAAGILLGIAGIAFLDDMGDAQAQLTEGDPILIHGEECKGTQNLVDGQNFSIYTGRDQCQGLD